MSDCWLDKERKCDSTCTAYEEGCSLLKVGQNILQQVTLLVSHIRRPVYPQPPPVWGDK